MRASLTPSTWRRTRAGLANGPRKFSTVGTPSSLRRIGHRLEEAGHLVDGLALHPEGDDETGDLRVRGVTGKHLAHRGGGRLQREVFARGQRAEDPRPAALFFEHQRSLPRGSAPYS